MKKDLIIFLHEFYLTYNYLERYEINELKKNFNIEFHVFNKILYPHYIPSYEKNLIKQKNIYNFSSLKEWKNILLKRKKNYNKLKRRIFVFDTLEKDKLMYFLIILFIRKQGMMRFEFKLHELLPNPYNFFNIFFKIKSLILRFNYSFVVFNNLVNSFLIKCSSFLFNLNPDFTFVSGEKNYNLLKKKEKKLIKLHSWQFSKVIKDKKKSLFKFQKPYVVYISTPSRNEASTDSKFFKSKSVITTNLYKKLNLLFKNLKKNYNLEIFIALHPKQIKKLPFLGDYKHYYLKTRELIKYSRAVILHDSSAYLYALYYKKPLKFVIDNSFKKNPSAYRHIHFLAMLLKNNVENIDDYNNNFENFTIDFGKKNYSKFLLENFSFKELKKKNCELIKDYLLKKDYLISH